MFSKIPRSSFERFHRLFKGNFYEACYACGGQCEYNKIGTLLPGEKEFIARRMGLPLLAFENRYLDKLETSLGTVDVLKLVYGCPFLDSRFNCTVKRFKPVLCEIYPIVLLAERGEVKFRIDERCPLSKDNFVRAHLVNVGAQAIRNLKVPPKFVNLIEQYDDLNFDYKKIEKTRKNREDCETFVLQDLLSFRLKSRDLPEKLAVQGPCVESLRRLHNGRRASAAQ